MSAPPTPAFPDIAFPTALDGPEDRAPAPSTETPAAPAPPSTETVSPQPAPSPAPAAAPVMGEQAPPAGPAITFPAVGQGLPSHDDPVWDQAHAQLTAQQTQVATAHDQLLAQYQETTQWLQRFGDRLTPEERQQYDAYQQQRAGQIQQYREAHGQYGAGYQRLADEREKARMRAVFEPLARKEIETQYMEKALALLPDLTDDERPAVTKWIKGQMGAIRHDARDVWPSLEASVANLREMRLHQRTAAGTDTMPGPTNTADSRNASAAEDIAAGVREAYARTRRR